jgi:hypothetical protein
MDHVVGNEPYRRDSMTEKHDVVSVFAARSIALLCMALPERQVVRWPVRIIRWRPMTRGAHCLGHG